MLDTKAYLEIQFNGYPVGKKVRCHIWVEGIISTEKLEEDLEKYIKLSGDFKDEKIHKIKVFNCFSTNVKKDDEKYYELIVNSELNAVNLNFDNNVKQSKKQKNNSFSPSTIKLTDMKDDDVVKLHQRLEEEILRRRYSLSTEEFKFYTENSKDFDISDTKDIYKKCNGDIIKIKKEKIRKKLEGLA